MSKLNLSLPEDYVCEVVRRSLAEDVGGGDLTAALVPDQPIVGTVISRDEAVVCGIDFFDQVFHELDPTIEIVWQVADGAHIRTDQHLCRITGPARPILTGERSALNLLQTLSGTATATRRCADLLDGLPTRILDTRKTLPGLRRAQKYAVRCGGGHNHRMGLFDGILIKENHLRSGESIAAALQRARASAPPGCLIEIEVEDLDQLQQALDAGAERVLLDNFSGPMLRDAVALNAGRAELEASGGIDEGNLRQVAETGVDFISMGALTKDLRAVDFSLLFESSMTDPPCAQQT